VTFGVYVHVPFCRTRCGYCDFTTYTLDELGADGSAAGVGGATGGEACGATPEGYVEAALREMRMARGVVEDRALPDPVPVADTVYFGGGTPTMLPVSALARLLAGISGEFGVADGA